MAKSYIVFRDGSKKDKIKVCVILGIVLLVILVFAVILPMQKESELNEMLSAIQNPVPVGSESDFLQMEKSGDYILTNDITLSKDWTPLGTRDRPFCGTINGAGHTLNAAAAKGADGFFPGLTGIAGDGCFVFDLTIQDCSVSEEKGAALVSGMAGTGGKAVFYRCILKGEDIPYYLFTDGGRRGDHDGIDTNLDLLLAGNGFRLSSSMNMDYEMTDENGNSIRLLSCAVETGK